MGLNTPKKLFLSTLFLFLPLIVFAQSGRTQSVALVPFWGDDEQFIEEFGEELFKAVGEMQGYRPVVIDMNNLPDDVPEGGFPPYICPSPSLIKTNPLAITGEMTPDPDDYEFWHLRLYLWEMEDTRLVFSDELTAYEREEAAAAMPGMLDWLFSWLKRGGSGEGDNIDLSDLYGQGKNVFITTSMPLHWMYVGGRFGWTPLRMQTLLSKGSSNDYIGNFYDTFNGTLSFSMALFPESVPFFSRMSFQVEGNFLFQINGIHKYKHYPVTEMSVIPATLLKFQAYRQGNMLLSLFGGAYTRLDLDEMMGLKKRVRYGMDFPVGIIAGLSYGGKLDPIPGIFFIDLRYSMDLYGTYVLVDKEGYKRRDVTVSVGYEYGLITKK